MIWIVTPAIDLIEIIAARGNTTLNSTVQLTVSLRNDINAFGKRMSEVMDAQNKSDQTSKEATKTIIDDMKALLARIEDAVPLISLALTTSGANLSASLPDTVSPSRLLQASAHLQAGDMYFDKDPTSETQIGPSFSLKLYTIFEGHSRNAQDPNVTNITWQETYAKSILEVIRMPMHADLGHNLENQRVHKIDYLYHFRVTENLDDGRYHEELIPGKFRRDAQGFIRGASRDIPVHNIARLFFSASGRLLNIEEARTPVLVLKINHALAGPSASLQAIFAGRSDDDADRYPRNQEEDTVGGHREFDQGSPDDLEWLALELWADEEESDSDFDDFDTASEQSSSSQNEDSVDGSAAGSHLLKSVARPKTSESEVDALAMQMQVLDVSKSLSVSQKTGNSMTELATLSLLEYILRLSALQTSEQQSVLSISDERISLFLRDDNAQSRSRSHQEAEAVRRKSHDRFDTPASSIFYDEFIPGTQVKSVRSRKTRYGTPSSNASTPSTSQQLPTKSNVPMTNLQTPKSVSAMRHEVPGTIGSRRWQHTSKKESSAAASQNDSPLIAKGTRPSKSANIFKTYNDLESKTNNGFSSRLRHSTRDSEPSSPVDLVDTSPVLASE